MAVFEKWYWTVAIYILFPFKHVFPIKTNCGGAVLIVIIFNRIVPVLLYAMAPVRQEMI
jgi:hypothetical protein